ncbi:Cof-type HAD-IIB family hydrolase [[Acholeplasma] multilocale]|uniref:Cof-type HAD-IIB family hydrolase n=1 Tax=[Acholeplasma] multilocale TaxID=264638 RepID=UPI0004787AE8|nr:Cof-type HAD-IIB family hydrolase [[Acholeplasma] multilocale]
MYKLIAVDVDGTLFPHGKNVHPKTKEAILKAQELNIPVVIATGRNISTITNVAAELNMMNTGIPFVSQNGAQVFTFEKDGKVNIEYTITYEDKESNWIFALAKRFKVTVYAYTQDEKIAYTNKRFSFMSCFMKYRSSRKSIFYKETESLVAPITKFLLFGKKTKMIELRKIVEEKGYNAFAFSYVSDSRQNIEVLPKGVDKAKGLECIIAKLGINQEDVIYFGDGENDIEAIKWAGHGVAMGNAKDYVKTHADAITTTCEQGGVGEYLFEKVFK